jgi:hypothetical protein
MLRGLKGREEPPWEAGGPCDSTSPTAALPSLPLSSSLAAGGGAVPGREGWEADLPRDASEAVLPFLRLEEPRSSSGSSAASVRGG